MEQYPFGGNPSLNIPSTPQRTPQTTTTTTTQSPPIVIEDHNTGGGDIWTPDQTFGGDQFGGSSGNNGGASFDPGKPFPSIDKALFVVGKLMYMPDKKWSVEWKCFGQKQGQFNSMHS